MRTVYFKNTPPNQFFVDKLRLKICRNKIVRHGPINSFRESSAANPGSHLSAWQEQQK